MCFFLHLFKAFLLLLCTLLPYPCFLLRRQGRSQTADKWDHGPVLNVGLGTGDWLHYWNGSSDPICSVDAEAEHVRAFSSPQETRSGLQSRNRYWREDKMNREVVWMNKYVYNVFICQKIYIFQSLQITIVTLLIITINIIQISETVQIANFKKDTENFFSLNLIFL